MILHIQMSILLKSRAHTNALMISTLISYITKTLLTDATIAKTRDYGVQLIISHEVGLPWDFMRSMAE